MSFMTFIMFNKFKKKNDFSFCIYCFILNIPYCVFDMNHDSDVDSKQYISSKTVKSMLDVSYTTLHRWAKTDKVRFIKTPFGQKRYNINDIQTILNFNSTPPQKTKICYCRVSSSKQMDDLNRQQDFFREKYPDHELVTDIGSGIN